LLTPSQRSDIVGAKPQLQGDVTRPVAGNADGQARVRINVIIQAMSCQGDDGGQANADAISNRMSARVWDLSGS